jgi:hypothetical protein
MKKLSYRTDPDILFGASVAPCPRKLDARQRRGVTGRVDAFGELLSSHE